MNERMRCDEKLFFLLDFTEAAASPAIAKPRPTGSKGEFHRRLKLEWIVSIARGIEP